MEKKNIEYKIVNGTSYNKNTPDKVVEILERARQNGTRIRIFLGDSETGRCWMEEYDVIGRIGRSCGLSKIPLLVKTSRSFGGGAILDDCIVKITINGQTEYVHPNFHMPEMTIVPSDMLEFTEAVLFDGGIVARFKKAGQAQRWIAFMKGERNSK